MGRICPQCGAIFGGGQEFCAHDGQRLGPQGTLVGIASDVQEDALIGQTVDGRYRVERRIGIGGMGVVYAATHVALGKRIALKVLRGAMAQDAEVVQRFVQEAQSASAIGHENIVDISDFGRTPDGSAYFVMEFLEGESLTAWMARSGPLRFSDAIPVIKQIAGALSAAHQRGIVHRDLKPDNVLLVRRGGRPFVKVLDFGIAKVAGAAAKLTRAGQVFGTPHYMSPEQAAGQTVDHRTDIYALGVIMYEMFQGRVPFDAETLMGILTKHMFEPPPALSAGALGAELASLEAVVTRTLAKKPEDRYGSMAALIEDLDKVLIGQNVQIATQIGVPVPTDLLSVAPRSDRSEADLTGPLVLPTRRTPLWVALGAAAVLLGVFFLYTRSGSGTPRSTSAPARTEGTEAARPHPVAPSTNEDVPPSVVVEERVTIDSEPSGAQVTLEGAVVGNTPLDVPRPRGAERHLELRLPGYRAEPVLITGTTASALFVPLVRERPEKRAGASTRRPIVFPNPRPPSQNNREAPRYRTEVVDPWQ